MPDALYSNRIYMHYTFICVICQAVRLIAKVHTWVTELGQESPGLLSLILTHILQTDFAREPGKTTRIAEASKISALSIRLSRSLPRMWVRIRSFKPGMD